MILPVSDVIVPQVIDPQEVHPADTGIHVTGLKQTYTARGLLPRTVLDIPIWTLQPGDQVLLRGESGSGKTSLLNILAGLLTPTAGSVMLAGTDLFQLSEARRDRFRAGHIGYIFQHHNLLPFTLLENVEMPLAFAGIGQAIRRERAGALLDSVGLGDFLNHHPRQISAGQRLRAAIARALINAPKLLLADEPTAALDPKNAAHILDLIQDQARTTGAILIMASHDPNVAARFPRDFSQMIALRDGALYPVEGAP